MDLVFNKIVENLDSNDNELSKCIEELVPEYQVNSRVETKKLA